MSSTISGLTDGGSIQPNDGFVIARGGNNYRISGTEMIAYIGNGSVTSVGLAVTSDFLVANTPITSSGNIALALNDTGVTPGTYTYATLTVDAKGRITLASSGAAPTGTVTSVGVSPGAGVYVIGSPITTSGTITVGLSNSGVTAGTYRAPLMTVDATGRVTSASNTTTVSSFTNDAGYVTLAGARAGISASGDLTYNAVTGVMSYTAVPQGVTSVAATGSADITVTGSPITSTGTLAFSLSDTTVTPGAYTLANVTVDAKGRITAIANGVSSLSNTGVTPGTYGVRNASFTVGADGRLTAVDGAWSTIGYYMGDWQNITVYKQGEIVRDAGQLWIVGGINGIYQTADRPSTQIIQGWDKIATIDAVTAVSFSSNTLTVTGSPVTSSGAITYDLPNTGVTAGTYSLPQVTVDATGRVTAISNGTVVGTGAVDSVNGYIGVVTLTASDIAGFANVALSGAYADLSGKPTLATVATSGAYADLTGKPSIPTKTSDLTNDSGFLTTNQSISLSGDVTGSGTTAITTALSNTGVTAGTYTFANITVDAKGRVTAISSGSVTGSGAVDSVNGKTGMVTLVASDITGFANVATTGSYADLTGKPTTVSSFTNDAGYVSNVVAALGYQPGTSNATGTVTSVAATGSADITVSGSPITTSGTLTFALTNTTVTPGSYTLSNITVDAKGRITAITNGTVSGTGTVTSVGITPGTGVTSSGGPITSSGNITVGLANSGVTAGTYTVSTASLTVDQYGRVTAATSGFSNLLNWRGSWQTITVYKPDELVTYQGALWKCLVQNTNAPSEGTFWTRIAVTGTLNINTQTGTSYTLTLNDGAQMVEMNNSAANTLTVPPNSSVAFPIGTNIVVTQYGTGTTTIVAGSGVTIRKTSTTLDISGQYGMVTLIKRGTDEWYAKGDLT